MVELTIIIKALYIPLYCRHIVLLSPLYGFSQGVLLLGYIISFRFGAWQVSDLPSLFAIPKKNTAETVHAEMGYSIDVKWCLNTQVTLENDHPLHANFLDLFKVFVALIFAAINVGLTSSLAPDYAKAKLSARKMFGLMRRQPKIDGYSEDGVKLVSQFILFILTNGVNT